MTIGENYSTSYPNLVYIYLQNINEFCTWCWGSVLGSFCGRTALCNTILYVVPYILVQTVVFGDVLLNIQLFCIATDLAAYTHRNCSAVGPPPLSHLFVTLANIKDMRCV